MALYSQRPKEEILREPEHDPIIGHIAMINDFVPYAFGAESDLKLELYIEDIKKKIRARKSRSAT